MAAFRLQRAEGESLVDLAQPAVEAAVMRRWLGRDDLVTAAGQHGAHRYLAVASGRTVILFSLGRRSAGGVLKEKARHRSFRFTTRGAEGDVSAMCWVAAGKGLAVEVPLLVVATTRGVLLVLRRTDKLVLLHRQQFGDRPVTALAQRTRGDKFGTVEALLVLCEPNLLTTIDGDALSRLADPRYAEGSSEEDLIRSLQDVDAADDDPAMLQAAPVATFSVLPALKKDGLPSRRQRLYPDTDEEEAINGIATVDRIRPAPLDVYNRAQLKWVVCAGRHPTLSAFDAPFENEEVSISAYAKDAAKKTLNLFTGALWGRGAAPEPEAPHSLAKLPKPAPLEASFAFNDTERVVERIFGDAGGRYVAVADNLGRVMVVDCLLFAVVKMLKGYRDARVVWLPPLPPAAGDRLNATPSNVFLVHLPRRGIVEAWAVASPQRLAAAKVGFDCRVVQCTPKRDAQCLLVYADGASATLELCAADIEAAQAPLKTPAEVQSSQLTKWRDACRDGATADELAELLGGMQLSAVDVLECVVTVPERLGAAAWVSVTGAAMDALERRGIGGADVVMRPEAEVHAGGGAGAAGAVDAVVPEHERLMGPNAPSVSEGEAYRYLVNRLSVLRVYLRLTSKPRRAGAQVPQSADAILGEWNAAFEAYRAEHDGGAAAGGGGVEDVISLTSSFLDSEYQSHDAARLAPSIQQLVRTNVVLAEEAYVPMGAAEFLSYFNILDRGTAVVRYDTKLAAFMCHTLVQWATPEQFADCCYALSLSNRTILDILLLWGATPRVLTAVVPLPALALLVSAPLLDALPGKSPRWLAELASIHQLRHAACMIFAARKRVADADASDTKLETIDGWLTQLLALLELRALMPAEGLPWVEDISLSVVSLVPPPSLAAAYCIATGTALRDAPALLTYLEARRGAVATFHAHSAMFLAYMYNRAAGAGWEGKGAGVVEFWVRIAEELCEQGAAGAAADGGSPGGDGPTQPHETISNALCHAGKAFEMMQPALFWCTTTLLAPLAALVDVARHCKSTVVSACAATQRDPAAVARHCEEAMRFLQLLVKDDAELEDDPISREWWAAGWYDAMLRTAKYSLHATPVPTDDLITLLTFLQASVHNDFVALPAFAAGGEVAWTKLFDADVLRLLQAPSPHAPARPAAPPATAERARHRAAFVAAALKDVPDVGRVQAVGAKLCKVLRVMETSFVTAEVIRRQLLEGYDGQATDALDALGTRTEEGTVYPPTQAALVAAVVRLRLRLLLTAPVAGGGTQRRQEQSLNLMSGLPLGLMDWVQREEGDRRTFSERERALAAEALAGTPLKTNYHRLKTLSQLALKQARFNGAAQEVVEHLASTLDYATYLQRNV
eukprot:TRINITY_DN27792_c0_g1_i1.p1 TRINITY_DN27792_c0_g1~~TRINITY_DN27792_c0_g1_i1.p1  ORF type:complete len:1390 (+),score=499.65 TRINITY_DN27792_c0_g1_i1:100-4170(+)